MFEISRRGVARSGPVARVISAVSSLEGGVPLGVVRALLRGTLGFLRAVVLRPGSPVIASLACFSTNSWIRFLRARFSLASSFSTAVATRQWKVVFSLGTSSMAM